MEKYPKQKDLTVADLLTWSTVDPLTQALIFKLEEHAVSGGSKYVQKVFQNVLVRAAEIRKENESRHEEHLVERKTRRKIELEIRIDDLGTDSDLFFKQARATKTMRKHLEAELCNLETELA